MAVAGTAAVFGCLPILGCLPNNDGMRDITCEQLHATAPNNNCPALNGLTNIHLSCLAHLVQSGLVTSREVYPQSENE